MHKLIYLSPKNYLINKIIRLHNERKWTQKRFIHMYYHNFI